MDVPNTDRVCQCAFARNDNEFKTMSCFVEDEIKFLGKLSGLSGKGLSAQTLYEKMAEKYGCTGDVCIAEGIMRDT